MKSKLTIVFIVFTVASVFAQKDDLVPEKEIETLKTKIDTLETKINELEKEKGNYVFKQEVQSLAEELDSISILNSKLLLENDSINNSLSIANKKYNILDSNFKLHSKNIDSEIDSLKTAINSNSANIQTNAKELGAKIKNTHKFANQGITDLNNTVNQNTLYWIIAVLIVAIFVLTVFVLLRKQIFKQKTDLDSNLQNTRKAIEEEGVNLDIKLAEILEKQLTIINEQRNKEDKTTTPKIDHSLVLKVADRLISMEKNLSRMDENTKGLKQLKKAVQSIKDNFASNGYELVEMIGKKYDEGMKASVTYNPDSDEESGIIIRIIKPQVNFKNQMIQAAQIEVSE